MLRNDETYHSDVYHVGSKCLESFISYIVKYVKETKLRRIPMKGA